MISDKEYNDIILNLLFKLPTEEEMNDPSFPKKVNDFYEDCKAKGLIKE